MNDRIKELEQRIENLKNRMPAHSIPPGMMAELDELEEQLAQEIRKHANTDQTDP